MAFERILKARYRRILDEEASAVEARAGLLALVADYQRRYPAAMAVIERDLDALVCHPGLSPPLERIPLDAHARISDPKPHRNQNFRRMYKPPVTGAVSRYRDSARGRRVRSAGDGPSKRPGRDRERFAPD